MIISEDVFEHIPRQGLSVLVPLMSRHLSRRGIALIRPMVWTGIKGGHSVEYYVYIGGPAPSNVPLWDHLREARHPANTFLNQLTRREYVELFETCFEVIEDEPLMPWLGRELLTGEIRDQLAHYDDYELFSNKVSFVLRPDRMDHSSQEHG